MKMKTLLALSLFLAANAAWAARPNVEFEEDNSLPIVYLNIVLDSGTAQDPPEKLGLANVANQMMLRGTQKHSKAEYFEMVNRLGAMLEVETRNEGTIFRGAVLSDNLGKFLELVTEALASPKFTSEELAKVKKETEGEILERKGNDKALVQYNFYRFFYGSHPYGHPDLGTQKGVKNITNKDIVDRYAQRFSGVTMRLFGTGAAKPGMIEEWFSALTDKLSAIHPDAKPAAPIAKHEVPAGRRALIVNKPNATQSQVLLGGQGMRPEQPGFYAILLANHSFGGGSFQARMMREIRVKRGWTYGAYNTFRFGREPRHYAMYIFPKTDDTGPALNLTLDLYEDFVKNGINQEEYNFARDSLVNSAPFNFDTSKKRLENATTEYMTNFPRGYFREFAGHIGNVRFDDVAPAVRGFFTPANLALTVVGDAKKLKGPVSKLPGFTAPAVKPYLED
jgi:zinc protease